ncbi:Alpha-ketoglutaric semialdehyde dehydrogenase [Vibrio nigripulchritudo SFn27]|uniref:Alpha-ketoglutaric semialdehyde dehydrogenase n=1 Tax=Vibrio nigripulchritudo TaxID=28173 RepID=U4K5F9_9VIBR|nr:aldehyde dehydrogenase (NADP(+)) [Vibrio nigripulchritudo]CCN81278.1 Alpha-ketoglutaric semialdehyde dehydrogenase [Vibrio nigripulchritudo BLFn1]CCN86601.1 Alpha-ketoglutaric semialdehyde dehydrogenase [Vibrio nigripulchritudo SFn27]CCN97152.1 Alpha-ketoglutaric semialdehyde dehydrogenase [Vibrio nigripulchritudo ENn2]CCO43015.1 Alpha-ketoglutaric semialdehyde dehydrogenase [Vibrio nigripulchritudo SFn135]CCO50651.1 Alpha-ketoglutaric semialdehyde dehydrogenase [Vibrio nigripulchritudo Wn1
MENLGKLVIAGQWVKGEGNPTHAVNPSTNQTLPNTFDTASSEQVVTACEQAERAWLTYSEFPRAKRGEFLQTIGSELLAREADIVHFGVLETGLPELRLKGELQRTVGQLNLFANALIDQDEPVLHDEALPERTPLPRPSLTLVKRSIGPVAVFGASNFPLAFSVAGGDTASALAAGCSVIVKAHSSHPHLSYLAASAIVAAIEKSGIPKGVFSLLSGSGSTIGGQLVSHPAIKGVGFTGSKKGGLALSRLAQQRNVPIPVFAEMSSINPVFITETALKESADDIAAGLTGSICLGAGQFCTNPGLILVENNSESEGFLRALSENVAAQSAQTMLNRHIRLSYQQGVERLENLGAKKLAEANAAKGEGENLCYPALFKISDAELLADPAVWQEEVFGSASLVVVAEDVSSIRQIIETLEGQLTFTFWLSEQGESEEVTSLVSLAQHKAGRIIFNGFPTGVEVCQSMVHGGPFPATSNTQYTSVGSTSIDRWLRPVCFQNVPDWLSST